MYGFTVFTLILCVTSVLCAPPNCSKPPPEVTAQKIRQCCNGPPIDKIMKETYGDQCKMGPPKGTTSGTISSSSSAPAAAATSAASTTAASSSTLANTAASSTAAATSTNKTPGSSSAPASGSPTSSSTGKPAGFKPSAAASCSAECMLNQTHVFANGEYNKANANTFLHDVIKDDDFTDILQKAMEECSDKSKSTAKTFEDPNGKCNPFSSIYLHCVTEHANQKCPESRWLQTTTCNKVRSYITACGVPNF
ncbi:spore coat protein SP96-like [Condylostylus longicornis]|uniref:spore coat protein SP96-like n=1 Tax=Condylostylus longicornis TaxID=2530218 RepID=UPI00244DBA38|nr:spore coat protein SP96-like [Condylostylus longicornis]